MKRLLWWVWVTSLCGWPAFSQEAEDLYRKPFIPLVALAATGEASEQASEAIVRLGVEAKENSLGEAIVKASEFRAQVVKALVDAGIPRGNVVMEKFSSTPEYGRFSGKVKSYTLVNMIEVTISSEDQFLAIARVVDSSSAVDYRSRRVEFDEDRSLEVEAARDAMAALMAKASAYGKALGVKLALVSFNEAPVVEEEGRYAAMAPPAAGSGGYSLAAKAMRSAPAAAALFTDFGEVTRVVGIHGFFRLEQ